MANQYSSDQPLIYQIKLKGHLSVQWSDWLGGVSLTLGDDGNTLLTSTVADQAALHGLLRQIRDTGLQLISVNAVEPD